MPITLHDIEKTAGLAKLAFSKKEKEEIAEDLARILTYVEKLEELDVDGVSETAHVMQESGGLRPDRVKKSLSKEETLRNAPAKKRGFFSVPKVIRGT